jgi:hypothetical protein
MWQFEQTPLERGRGVRVRVSHGGRPVDHGSFLRALEQEQGVRDGLIGQLAACDYEAFFWEVQPVTAQASRRPFEYVVIESQSLLEMRPDPHSFRSHFSQESGVVSFDNIGADAHLIAPCPFAKHEAYVHLGAFVRYAPREQVDLLFARVAELTLARVGEQPLWLSTCGLGVAWLHVRLDSWPKYYRYEPYRSAPPAQQAAQRPACKTIGSAKRVRH